MQSSANSLVWELIFSRRSLINIRKSTGPHTDPCGTPFTTGTFSDDCPSTITSWDLFPRKDAIHMNVMPLMS